MIPSNHDLNYELGCNLADIEKEKFLHRSHIDPPEVKGKSFSKVSFLFFFFFFLGQGFMPLQDHFTGRWANRSIGDKLVVHLQESISMAENNKYVLKRRYAINDGR